MNQTFFLQESYVIATIMKTKDKYLKEQFATFKEVNIIKSMLQNEFNKKNLDVCITSTIEREFFTIHDNVIFLNKERNVRIKDIEGRYKGYCPNIDILIVLWNEKLILDSILELKKQEYDELVKIKESVFNECKIKVLK